MSKQLPIAKPVFARWLPVALASLGILAFAYVAVQQNYRQSANDPQIQMAEDTAAALDHGSSPSSLLPSQTVDRGRSLAPFIIIVDKQQQIVATNVSRDTDSALPPSGVFKSADAHGEQRFTWQTSQGKRFATVVTSSSAGYVVAARSLKEVEAREDTLTVLGWVATLGVLALTLLAVVIIR